MLTHHFLRSSQGPVLQLRAVTSLRCASSSSSPSPSPSTPPPPPPPAGSPSTYRPTMRLHKLWENHWEESYRRAFPDDDTPPPADGKKEGDPKAAPKKKKRVSMLREYKDASIAEFGKPLIMPGPVTLGNRSHDFVQRLKEQSDEAAKQLEDLSQQMREAGIPQDYHFWASMRVRLLNVPGYVFIRRLFNRNYDPLEDLKDAQAEIAETPRPLVKPAQPTDATTATTDTATAAATTTATTATTPVTPPAAPAPSVSPSVSATATAATSQANVKAREVPKPTVERKVVEKEQQREREREQERVPEPEFASAATAQGIDEAGSGRDLVLRPESQFEGTWNRIKERFSGGGGYTTVLGPGSTPKEGEAQSSSWTERLFPETDTAHCLREIRARDPTFTPDSFAENLRENMLPALLRAMLRGDRKTLRALTGEAVYHTLDAVMREREREGTQVVSQLLFVKQCEITEAKLLENNQPVLIVAFNAQQTHCIKDKKGAIIDGAEDAIRIVHYIMALRQKERADQWIVGELHILGSFPTLI